MKQATECWFNQQHDLIGIILNEINNAKERVYLMHFWFTWKPIADALIIANNKGLDIQQNNIFMKFQMILFGRNLKSFMKVKLKLGS